MKCYTSDTSQAALPLIALTVADYPTWLTTQSVYVKNWLAANHFQIDKAQHCLIPDETGQMTAVIFSMDVEADDNDAFWRASQLAAALPPGTYALPKEFSPEQQHHFSLAWGLVSYRFDRYKTVAAAEQVLCLPATTLQQAVENSVQAIFLIRDLINTPSEDMGPEQLAEAMRTLAVQHKAHFKACVGEALLAENYPMVHTVGRASAQVPRLLSLHWGSDMHPKVTLVGKGVCFDSGGLDLKPSRGMRLMKKDMGGAAHVLGLASMIMSAALPIQLCVLIPAVENVVAGNAYRPGDVLQTRKGLTVEVGNTDAEGRLVLADALTAACEDKPDLIIDFATLTGAARIALGTELPALFSNRDAVAAGIVAAAEKVCDPVWPMPLFKPYKRLLKSTLADLNNDGGGGYGGAIMAALFLQAFVDDDIPWVHFDLMAWNRSAQPGRPEGGEAMALRAVFAYLQATYSETLR